MVARLDNEWVYALTEQGRNAILSCAQFAGDAYVFWPVDCVYWCNGLLRDLTTVPDATIPSSGRYWYLVSADGLTYYGAFEEPVDWPIVIDLETYANCKTFD